MKTVSVKDAKNKLTELIRTAESGETIVVTRNGVPVVDIIPHKKKGKIDLEAGQRWLKERGYENKVWYIAPDFDDPLPEDFLITPEKR